MRHRRIRHPRFVAGIVVVAVLAVGVPIVVAQMSGDPFPRPDTPGQCFGCATTAAQNPLVELQQLGITGYATPWNVQPGDTVSFHVSSDVGNYTSQMVRVFNLDNNPAGPGINQQALPSPSNGTHTGTHHDLPVGSYVDVPSSGAVGVGRSFTITAWIAPTTIPGTEYNQLATVWTPTSTDQQQGIVSKWSGNSGYSLVLDQSGALALRLGNGTRTAEVSTGTKLRPWAPALPGGVSYIPTGQPGAGTPSFGKLTGTNSTWYFVAASYNARTGRVTLVQDPQNNIVDTTRVATQSTTTVGRVASNTSPLLMAAGSLNPNGTDNESYNGKIDNPRIYDRALSPAALRQIAQGGGPAPTVGWDFTRDQRSDVIHDTANSAALTGHTVNMPERAVTGHNWHGSLNYQTDPEQYGGIYFHQDDLNNANWPTAFTYKVPNDAESGVYAAELQAGGHTYWAQFFVHPKNYTPTSSIALVIPTNSYLAYGVTGPAPSQGRAFGFCLYCRHADGSSYQYSSRLRPLTNQEPQIGVRPWQFVADTHITDWLHAKGIKVDIITDQDINNQGAALLGRYRVVMTASHPEYISDNEFAAFKSYETHGGRTMYIGANGFYWVTGMGGGPAATYVEVRRQNGTEAYQIPAAEKYMTTTGEEGGLWRFRNMAPQSVVDTGFTAQGFDAVRPYKRLPDSFNPEAAFIFKGIGPNEQIGDFPSLQLSGNGAAGEEIDRADYSLGTPANTLILARAGDFSDAYQLVVEEVQSSDSLEGGTVNPLVYADMAYNKFLGGGAVFATSSISWAGSLYYNNYNNSVSTVTGNVLTQFNTPGPLP
jgi:N,N-dimethylformamidase